MHSKYIILIRVFGHGCFVIDAQVLLEPKFGCVCPFYMINKNSRHSLATSELCVGAVTLKAPAPQQSPGLGLTSGVESRDQSQYGH